MNKIFRPLLITTAVFMFFLATGCEDNATNVHDEHSLAEHACEHMTDGPDSMVTAVLTGIGPDIVTEHTRFDITLADTTGGQKGGYVTFTPAEHGEFAFFLDKQVSITVVDPTDSTVSPEDEELHLDDCASIVSGGLYHLEEKTYKLYLGPTSETTVSIVVEEGGHEDIH